MNPVLGKPYSLVLCLTALSAAVACSEEADPANTTDGGSGGGQSTAATGGKTTYAQPEDLEDPWGQPYRYDADGPKNDGHRPDIWAVTPGGETIGNWPVKR